MDNTLTEICQSLKREWDHTYPKKVLADSVLFQIRQGSVLFIVSLSAQIYDMAEAGE